MAMKELKPNKVDIVCNKVRKRIKEEKEKTKLLDVIIKECLDKIEKENGKDK
jgi:hypothetical protein